MRREEERKGGEWSVGLGVCDVAVSEYGSDI